MRLDELPDIIHRARAINEARDRGDAFGKFPPSEALAFAWALTVLADREAVAARPEARTQLPNGMKLVPDQPVMWRREWDGDVSDEGQWVYAATREELDEYGPWEPLYSELGPL